MLKITNQEAEWIFKAKMIMKDKMTYKKNQIKINKVNIHKSMKHFNIRIKIKI